MFAGINTSRLKTHLGGFEPSTVFMNTLQRLKKLNA
jgi:hypothetical protein